MESNLEKIQTFEENLQNIEEQNSASQEIEIGMDNSLYSESSENICENNEEPENNFKNLKEKIAALYEKLEHPEPINLDLVSKEDEPLDIEEPGEIEDASKTLDEKEDNEEGNDEDIKTCIGIFTPEDDDSAYSTPKQNYNFDEDESNEWLEDSD
jgi:hypothetical protein